MPKHVFSLTTIFLTCLIQTVNRKLNAVTLCTKLCFTQFVATLLLHENNSCSQKALSRLNTLVDLSEILFRIWQLALPIIDPDDSNTVCHAMKHFTHKPSARQGWLK